MTSPTGIIVLEGADGAGKTTLARHLVERYGARYLHSTVRRDVWRWHVATLRQAVQEGKSRLVILDRHWLSEQAYGQAYRGGPAYDLGARCIDRVLLANGAVTVLCAPRDVAGQVERHSVLRGQRREHFDQIERVAHLYADLANGNLAHPGRTYLDQLIRYGDFARRPDVVLYDWQTHGDRLAMVGESITGFLELNLRAPDGVVGGLSHRTRYLFVGEQLSPRWPVSLAACSWPFFWDDSTSSATWLNASLHHLAHDETTSLFVNGVSREATLRRLVELTRPSLRVIALGNLAEEAAERYWPRSQIRRIPHPQWARRFQFKTPEIYRETLRRAMTS